MAGFKKRTIDPARVISATDAASAAPITGDLRTSAPSVLAQTLGLSSPESSPLSSNLGARQDLLNVAGYQVGQVYEVPIGSIKPNPFNPRVIYTSSAVDELVESLGSEGQQVAATAFLDAAGNVTLIDGEKRLRAARAGGLPTLRVEIRPRPESDRQLYEAARSTNSKRSEQSPLDDAIRWREMLEKGVYSSQVNLSKSLALPEDVVSRTLKLAALPQRVLQALAEDADLLKLRLLNAVREFCEATTVEQTLDLITEISRKGLGYREVEARRKSLEKGHISKPRAIREPVRYGSATGELKTFPDGRLELSLKGLDEEQAEDLRLKLVQALKAMATA
jgi:ParB family chromosome partitioning protein